MNMNAISIRQPGGPEQLVLSQLPVPEPVPGHVVIRVAAFGLNHAEVYFRSGAWPDGAPVTGIECVGTIHADPSGRLAAGQKVAAMVGGLGRSLNGSYAEYTLAPASNVVAIESDLPWAELAALPESYATAWVCLHHNLELAPDDVLLVRGGTSALGQAAINIAAELGARVIATTRQPERLATLSAIGATTPVLDAPDLSTQLRGEYTQGVDAVLDLVGTSTLLDSLRATRVGGRVCMAGFLGGANAWTDFDPLQHLPSGVHLSFFGSAFVLGNEDYPLDGVPFADLVQKAEAGIYSAKPAHVFGFDDIQSAHQLLESGAANGKIVVVVNPQD